MDDALSFDSLFAGAKKFAHLAIQAHADGDEEVFVLHAGVSFERLMKSALSRANPMLLMESAKHSDELLLRFAGVPRVKKSDAGAASGSFRTIGASDALKRVRLAGWLSEHRELENLIALRNGVAHLGHTSSESADIFAVFARSTNALLGHLGESLRDYWGDWERMIDVSINENMAKGEREVRRRVEQARRSFELRVEKLPKGIEDSLRKGTYPLPLGELSNGESMFVTGEIRCPACSCNASIAFVDYLIGSGSDEERWNSVSFLLCQACGLRLEGAGELNAAGVDVRWAELPEITLLGMVEFYNQPDRFENPD
ncbi:hypothetical protein ACIQNI_21370 [Streptomyces sp. NPDC091266]|uniref:hypothetical protein n=1 Tax=Streptomyces sp. NPDC091266 TaxID=3365978 RepID=UPI00382E33AE